MQDGPQDGVLLLLQGTPQAGQRLNDCAAPQVFDVAPRDRADPLEVHDLVIKAQCLLAVDDSVVHLRSDRGGVLNCSLIGRTTSASATAWSTLSENSATAAELDG